MTILASDKEGKRLQQQARQEARSPWVGHLGRIGLAAQGVCFGIIGALAIGLALGVSGEATDQQGAFDAMARNGWTRILLVPLAAGFVAYSLWRFAQALFDRGGAGRNPSGLGRRAIQFAQGLVYLWLAWSAVHVLLQAHPRSSDQQHQAAGVLGWPGGRELVGLAAAGLLIAAGVIAYWALSSRFKESLATDEMSPREETIANTLGMIGLLSLALVSVVIAWFLFKAALQFAPQDAVSVGGALSKLSRAVYGSYLLVTVAAGLIAFALFDLFRARYQRT